MQTLFSPPEASITLAHADWSVSPAKRWLTLAQRSAGGTSLRVHSPQLAPDCDALLRWLAAHPLPLCLGLDLPLGVPLAYAERAGIPSFRWLLHRAGGDGWESFYAPAERADQIALRRPFYPQRPGGTSRAQLIAGLGLEREAQLLRVCDRAYPGRRSSAPIFWTMGAQQVGKAALHAWRELVAPALRCARPAQLWPMDGDLDVLLRRGGAILAEVYPRECYGQLGIAAALRNKRAQPDRIAAGEILLAWARERPLELDPALVSELRHGCGDRPSAEDAFDSIVGLFGMIDVALGARRAGEPANPAIRQIEGWILGQRAAVVPTR